MIRKTGAGFSGSAFEPFVILQIKAASARPFCCGALLAAGPTTRG
jgi:hypothetical protein